MVPVDLIRERRLAPGAKCLYLALLDLCEPNSRRCTVTQSKLLELVGVHSYHTLYGYLNQLKGTGWLRSESRRGHDSFFELLNPAEAARELELQRMDRRISQVRSLGEACMKEYLNLFVDSQEFQDNVRPRFLVNPRTGEPMELDRWYVKLRVALEFNGPQHYGPTEVYSDLGKVREQRARDLMKEALCQEAGIKLIVVVPDDLTYDGMLSKLQGQLPLRNVARDDPLMRYVISVSDRYLKKIHQERGLTGRHPGAAPHPARPR